MELKNYQRAVIRDLERYLEILMQTGSIETPTAACGKKSTFRWDRAECPGIRIFCRAWQMSA